MFAARIPSLRAGQIPEGVRCRPQLPGCVTGASRGSWEHSWPQEAAVRNQGCRHPVLSGASGDAAWLSPG